MAPNTSKEMTITPIRDASGQVSNFIAIKQDISEKRHLEEHRARLIGVLESTPDFVGIADVNYRPLFLNHAGRAMLQFGADEPLPAEHIATCHPDWVRTRLMNEAIPTAIARGSWTGETALVRKDGQQIPVSQAIVAHKADDGRVSFFSTIMRDLTEQKKLEQQLRQAQKMEAGGSWQAAWLTISTTCSRSSPAMAKSC